jgi:hypothetical protein
VIIILDVWTTNVTATGQYLKIKKDIVLHRIASWVTLFGSLKGFARWVWAIVMRCIYGNGNGVKERELSVTDM